MTIDPQRVGKSPGITKIRLYAAGCLARAIGFSCLGIDRVDSAVFSLQEPFDERPLAGLNADGQRRERLDFFAPKLPSSGRVLKLEIGDNTPMCIDDRLAQSNPAKCLKVFQSFM